MEEKTKLGTKVWYECGTCKKKMETISIGGGGDLFGLSSGSKQGLYCDNKECDKFGYLTIAGIKKEE